MQSQACSDPIYRSAGIMQIYQQSGFRFQKRAVFLNRRKSAQASIVRICLNSLYEFRKKLV